MDSSFAKAMSVKLRICDFASIFYGAVYIMSSARFSNGELQLVPRGVGPRAP